MRKVFDREKETFNLARLKTHGHKFEVVIDPDLAMEYRKGKSKDLREILQSENIFHDAKKGQFASEELMENVFGTTEPIEVAEKIIKEGEIQLTEEYRDHEREAKRKKVIDLINRYAVDPKNDSPHPRTRIENAMNEAKVRIDDQKKAEDQIHDIVAKLRPILPIKFEIKEIEIHLKSEYAAKLYGTIQKFGKILNENWENDGSWRGVVEIPAGLEPDLYERLNNETHGSVDTKVIKVK